MPTCKKPQLSAAAFAEWLEQVQVEKHNAPSRVLAEITRMAHEAHNAEDITKFATRGVLTEKFGLSGSYTKEILTRLSRQGQIKKLTIGTQWYWIPVVDTDSETAHI
jgi:predicted nucleotidyltransferase